MPLVASVAGHTPDISRAHFIAPNATIVGDVTLEAGVSVWYGCVLRAEAAPIRIGPDTNLQDATVIHTDEEAPTIVGARVTVGHRALLHGCTIEDDVLVGMSATVLNHAVVGRGALVAAGALVRERATIPPAALAVGVPAQIRDNRVPPESLPFPNVANYLDLAVQHAAIWQDGELTADTQQSM